MITKMVPNVNRGGPLRQSIVETAAAFGSISILWSILPHNVAISVALVIAIATPLLSKLDIEFSPKIRRRLYGVWFVVCVVVAIFAFRIANEPSGKIYFEEHQQRTIKSDKNNTRTPLTVTFLANENLPSAFPVLTEIRRVTSDKDPLKFESTDCVYDERSASLSLCDFDISLDWFSISGSDPFSPRPVAKNSKKKIVIFHMNSTKKNLTIFSNTDLADLSYIKSTDPNRDEHSLPVGEYIIEIEVQDKKTSDIYIRQKFDVCWAGNGSFNMIPLGRESCRNKRPLRL